MLKILAIFPGIGFSILSGLYLTVAKIYDIMLTLSNYYNDAGVPDNYIITTTNVMTTMYTLAGVFMLFRVTLSMINFLIEPDKLNDAQAGPTKMITRIITSLAMLLLFVPNGWIFNKNPDDPGILMRIERALLAEDGLVHSMIPSVNENMSSGDGVVNSMISSVNAASDRYDCYYIWVRNYKPNESHYYTEYNSEKQRGVRGVMHITFIADGGAGSKKLCLGSDNQCGYSFETDTTSPYMEYQDPIENGTVYNKITWQKRTSWPQKHACPNFIENGKAYDTNADEWHKEGNGGWRGGWHSPETMKADMQKYAYYFEGVDAQTEAELSELLGKDNNYIHNVSNEAARFAQAALAAFIECGENDSECEKLKETMLLTSVENSAMSDILNDDNSGATLDFVIGLVAGIGLVVWIAVLCVEVIIRRFKLILLEMMAPIPIISYVDPNDKIFKKWGEMYISTYLELFLKLIAIGFAIALLKSVATAVEGSGLLMFFYIIAILLFAKMIPDMISKVFGIDIASGSFKDIAGMGKKVLGFGAGAAVLGGLALGTGLRASRAAGTDYDGTNKRQWKKDIKDKDKTDAEREEARQKLANYNAQRRERRIATVGGVASGFAGFFRGAAVGASGSPGKILESAKTTAAHHEERRKKYASGLTTGNLISAATVGKVGMDYASQVDREVAPLLDRKAAADEVPSALDVPLAAYKKTGFAQTLDTLLKTGKITGSEHKSLTKDYLDWQSTLLGDAYGEVDGDGNLTGKLDLSKVKSAVESGSISASRAADIIMNDIKFQTAANGKISDEQQKAYIDLNMSIFGDAYKNYGEVDGDGNLTGRLDTAKINAAVAAGTLSKDDAANLTSNDEKFNAVVSGEDAIRDDLAGDVKVEIGVQNTLATAIDTVKSKAKGSSYFKDAIGGLERIVDFNDLDTAINNSYDKSKKLSAEINAKTVADSKYVASKAAQSSSNNN